MDKIFIDTSGFYALADKGEGDNHNRTKSLFYKKDIMWYSSNYIFDEIATLLLYRTSKDNSVYFCNGIRESEKIIWVFIREEDELKAYEIFKDFKDKNWSFTDCTSYILLKKNNINKILTFDYHFNQMGFRVIP